MDEELTYIRLYCNKCGNILCGVYPIGSWVNTDAELLGCTRGVKEDLAAQYEHLQEEVMPFLPMNDNMQIKEKIYNEVDAVEQQIYDAPLGVVLDEKGKAKK